MSNKIFSNDEISALAYEANQLASAGYESDAQRVRRQSINFAPLFDKVSSAVASLFSRDLPAALAYEARQMAAAGCLPEATDEKETGLFEKVTAWMKKPAPRHASAPRLAHNVSR
jgi:hypothetical protein